MDWKALAAALLAAAAAHAGAATLAGEARQLHDWVMKARDHHGLPFAIVDKRHAQLFVFDRGGQLKGHSTVLLGQARGDDTAPGVGEHAQDGYVPPEERTTPAGRFESQPGVTPEGDRNVWLDYQSAFAIHRVRPGKSYRPRLARLASPDPAQHRVSYGCVVVPVKFFEHVVQRWLGKGKGVVYVLPEQTSAAEFFAGL